MNGIRITARDEGTREFNSCPILIFFHLPSYVWGSDSMTQRACLFQPSLNNPESPAGMGRSSDLRMNELMALLGYAPQSRSTRPGFLYRVSIYVMNNRFPLLFALG